MVMRWMLRLLRSLSTPHLLQFFSFVEGLSLLLMLSGVFCSMGSLPVGLRLLRSAVLARVDLFSTWSLGVIGFLSPLPLPPDLHGLYKWVFDAPGLLEDFVQQVVEVRRDSY